MSSTHILYLVERALKAHLDAQEFANPIPVYMGMSVDRDSVGEIVEMALPRVICVCQSASGVVQASGSWECTATITVQTSADDNEAATHHTLCTQVFDSLITDTITADLEAAESELMVSGVFFRSMAWSVQDRTWTSELTLQIDCAGTPST